MKHLIALFLGLTLIGLFIFLVSGCDSDVGAWQDESPPMCGSEEILCRTWDINWNSCPSPEHYYKYADDSVPSPKCSSFTEIYPRDKNAPRGTCPGCNGSCGITTTRYVDATPKKITETIDVFDECANCRTIQTARYYKCK